jgi:cell division protein ZapA
MTQEKLTIHIKIDDRTYPLTIHRQDEEKIRRAADMLNNRLDKYKKSFSDKDSYDYLAMAAIQFVVELVDNDYDTVVKTFSNEIKQINSDIDVYLDQNFND